MSAIEELRAPAAYVAAVERKPPTPRTRLLVDARVVRRATLAALAASILLWPIYAEQSPWLAVGLGLTAFVVWHAVAAAYVVPWLCGVMAIGACVQWVVAPWIVYRVQATASVASMAIGPREYFAFAVPAAVAWIGGLYLPLWRPRGWRPSPQRFAQPYAPRGLRAMCNVMIGGGLAVRILVVPFAPGSLRFALYLLSLLSFVGAMALLLLDERGWRWRILLVLGATAVSNAASLQFLEIFLWTICVGALVLYRFRPRPLRVAAFALPALVVFVAVNSFKAVRRDELRREQGLSDRDRAVAASTAVAELASRPTRVLSAAGVLGTVSRLNEGWVISRLLVWVPQAEPYARGETIIEGLSAALLPRVLAPGKYVAGGAELIPRFTGIRLINATSIGLSVPGEMYANFGKLGGWLGTFVLAFVLGKVFAWFVRREAVSILWWAWAPVLLFSALSTEQPFGEIANNLSKAAIVMWAVVMTVPEWRRVLRRSARAPAPAAAAFAPSSHVAAKPRTTA